jgi:preprotein translocase subunit Sec63
MRDLDRVTRIARGALNDAGDESPGAEVAFDVPQTSFDAYRVLGLNSEAPAIAVKKVVDALRMTWHQDRARDESDRQHREHRIKQINAAWDLLKVMREAA